MPLDHDLVGIADVIERRDLTTGKLLAILMSQHLHLELRAVRVALGAQTVDAVKAVVTHRRANLLLGNRPPPSQELRAAFAGQEAWTTSSLNSILYFFMKPLEVCPTSGGSSDAAQFMSSRKDVKEIGALIGSSGQCTCPHELDEQ